MQNNNNDSEPYDCELKSLIDKCNMCNSNLHSDGVRSLLGGHHDDGENVFEFFARD